MMVARRGATSIQKRMIGLKRYVRPALAVSIIAHVGLLIVGPLLAGVNVFQPPPPPPPPDAMVVEIVTQEDMPRFQGTPSMRRSSGSETSSPSNGPNAVSQAPPPRSHQQPAEQTQQRPPPPDAKASSAQRPTPSETQNQSSEPQPATSETQPEEAPDQPNTADALAKYALAGGPLGGGFALPPIDTIQAGYDFTAPFRERVSSCSQLLPGVTSEDKVKVKIRVSFNRDGTLAGAPRLVGPPPSSKQQALFESAVNALEKCQPYGMLPLERYKQWKTLVLEIFPVNFFR
jgi:hypothetical protein